MTLVNEQGLALIRKWESLRLKAYRCQAGKWTIGYGTTTAAGVTDGAGQRVEVGPGMTCTRNEAESWLRQHCLRLAQQIAPTLQRRPNAHQAAAILSLVYNIGIGYWQTSTCLRRFNAGDIRGAAGALEWWNKTTINGKKVISRGLVRRRAEEADVFEGGAHRIVGPHDETTSVAPAARDDVAPERASPLGSRTIQGAGMAGIGTMVAMGEDWLYQASSFSTMFGISPKFVLGVVILGGLIWVIRERLRKRDQGDR